LEKENKYIIGTNTHLMISHLKVDLKIDYQTGDFTFFNLKVCETVSIEKPEEIEVF